ncbi:MAG TPA: TetR family transcriptional regulator [Rhizomicrobium sp.]|jgi:TPR repeat protein
MGSLAQSEAKPKFAVQRNAARTAILEAARRLALRDSASAFSLATVAKEAGFVAATVYGYFRSKEELILAVIAEDLVALAALMRTGRSAEDSANTDNSATAAQEEPAADSQAAPTPVEAATAAVAVSPALVDPQPEKGAAAAAQPEPQSAEPANVVRPSFTDDRPRVDAWLERRLRVFERALTDLERRMTESESRAANSDSRSTDAAQTLLQRMDEFERQQNELQQKLAQRTEALERRQKGLSAEMRAGLNDASGRIERLELGKASMPREAGASPTVTEDDASTDAESSSGDGITIGRESRSEEDGYIAAARRAASAAAVLSDIHTGHTPEVRSSWRRFVETRVRLSRKQNMLAGSATFLLFVIGAYAAFQIGHAGGREGRVAAVAHPAVAVAQRVSVAARKTAAATPLDRLSALAAAGDPRAELMIGLKYLHGHDVKADASRAFRWVEKAASAHEPLAQYWLGIMYQHGNGTQPDSVAALRWYEAAAGQGNCRAMHALGVAYAEGEGTGKDLAQAAHWFQRAAELGYVNSQFNLAVLYERGDGVPQSLGEAYKWYSIAAAQGDQESRTRVEALKSQLPQSDLQEAQLAAQQFHAASIDRQANVVPAMADLASSALISR